MISTKFNFEEGFLDTKFTGDINLQQIVDYIVETKHNQEYPRILKILTDAKDAELKFPIDSLSTIIDENNKSLQNYNAIIDAIVIDKPRETAVSLMYQELSTSKKYVFSVFSTRSAAKKWLSNYEYHKSPTDLDD